MTDSSPHSVTKREPARRIETHDGRVIHDAHCPFCKETVVESDGDVAGCGHSTGDISHERDGSYFIFEAPLLRSHSCPTYVPDRF